MDLNLHFELEVRRFFDAAHQLPDSDDLVTKECARLHGHTYLAVVKFSALGNDRNGMVVDFKVIKNIVDILDHKFINEVFEEYKFDQPPTAENIAKFIWFKINEAYPDLDGLSVAVCEGYKGDTQSSWVVYA